MVHDSPKSKTMIMPWVNLMGPNCQIHYNQITQRKH